MKFDADDALFIKMMMSIYLPIYLHGRMEIYMA